MLNRFYKYLTDKLIDYFQVSKIKGGERFYLQFDNEKQVNTFYEFLRNHDISEEFNYRHRQGVPYSTFAMKINDIDVVVAATNGRVTPDFLVTLRNEVGLQKGEWENTALLSICYETLDSIRGGSSDLQKEGMPLNVKNILKNLEEVIDKNKSLTTEHKEILKFHLKKKKEESFIQSSIWDYTEILGFLSQGEIKKEDFPRLGLFHDSNLDQFSKGQMKNRLEDNHFLFQKVQHIHEYENLQNQLEKLFDDRGTQLLKKEDWKENEYSAIRSSYESSLQADLPIEYVEGKGNLTDEGLPYWEKPQLETKAGQRKRHIVIFNPDKQSDMEMTFEFNDWLRKEFIHKKSAAICRISGKKLIVKLEHNPGTTTFHQVVYTHNNQSKSRYVFNIAILDCSPAMIEDVKTLFEVNVKENTIILNRRDETITFGSAKGSLEEVSVDEMGQVLTLGEKGIIISDESTAWVDDYLTFRIRTEGTTMPFMVKEMVSKVTPINGMRLWKMKRENETDFSYDINTNKLKQNSREFSASNEVKSFLMDEIEWVKNGFHYAERTSKSLEGRTLDLEVELLDAYEKLLNYYRHNNLIPSLAYMNAELVDLSKEYVNRFIQYISEIKDDTIMNERTKNIFKLGTIHEIDKISLSPLHPLNVAYQMEVRNRLQDEQVDLHILERLNPNNLLPYIYGDSDQLYRPVSQKIAPNWLVYEPIQKVAIGESNAFLSHVVEEKLKQFVEHFPFLFLNSSKSPIQLNVINISNDDEIVRGLIEFLKKQVQKNGPSGIIPIEISIYNQDKQPSAFERFSMIDEAEELEQAFDIQLKTNNLDKVDVLRLIRDNILYYRRSNLNEYDYAHISFYKMLSNDRPATNRMDEIDTGLSLDGLISSQSYLETEHDYRTGFGIKGAEHKSNLLFELAKSVNELASNLEYNGVKPYRKGESIVTRTAAYDTEVLNQLYDASYWVTFIEPSVDLGFFQSSSRNLLIIHYSDQYTSSSQYDAITVTDKSNQYRSIIEQFLSSKDIYATEEEIKKAILAFNSFNGEWLLRIIGNKSQFSREKLSIVSAIKYALSILDHGDIHWIPVSLEEIIRIAGVTRLTKNEGIFSAKNLNVSGVHSDDLLLIGVENRGNSVFIHYYPVEVKLGLNTSGAINKGKEQIKKTYNLFKTQLAKDEDDGRQRFKNQFFRNFFIQIMFSNIEKLIENGIWKEKDYNRIFSIKEKLLNDDYELSSHLSPFIGKGAVLSFKNSQTWKSVKREEDILMIDLTEDDGYSGVVEDIEELKNMVQQGDTDIDPDSLLINKYQFNGGAGITTPEKEEPEAAGYQDKVSVVSEHENEQEDDIAEPTVLERPIDDVRVLLGTAEGSKKDIYWEYGHPELANRHLMISGKSGQGKSYFIQCLLLELSKQGVSNIIFDYTDGFKSSKLEPEFRAAMGGNLEQFLVALNKFPIDPFKRNQKELDEGIYIDEDDTDIAERIKAVFSAVFKDLGIQQQNAIYEAVLRGLNKYGESMSLELLISELEEDSSGPAKTARSQIKPLIDKNPFKNEDNYNWDELIKQKGKVFIIQLTGYNREVQMMITEFILWDLWNHLLNHGDKSKPLTVVLDEAQNLDHREKSPSAKILTEGRKFGWSGSYATQSFKGQFSADEISRLQGASQKIYFMPPENEISSIASNLARDTQEKKVWEENLSRLKKGQCIVSGPMLQTDGSLAQGSPTIINIKSLMERNR